MTKPQPLEAVASTIRRLARDGETNWSFGYVYPSGSTHSIDEMEDDGIKHTDALYVLKRCRVSKAELSKYGEWRYVAEGKNSDGIAMVFVVTITEEPQEIEVVTAWVKGVR